MFDSGSDLDRRALERLTTERIAWLTTVTPDGQPQTLPIWFLWDGETIVVYSDIRAKRNANLAANPKVAFHLADDGEGYGIVFVEGEAAIDDRLPALPDHAGYLAKYGDWIRDRYGSPEEFAERYNVPIVIHPRRGRAPY